MKLKPRFSLKAIFLLSTLAAIVVYFVPVEYRATCDGIQTLASTSSMEETNVDIQGRNRNQPFEDVILNVPLTSVERSNDPRNGKWKIAFRTNLYNYIKLQKYDILRFRNSN